MNPERPARIEYTMDDATKQKWFVSSLKPRKDRRDAGDHIGDDLRNIELTEAELLANAARQSGYSVADIIRRGAIAEAKKLVTISEGIAKVKSGRGIAGTRDAEYIAAIETMDAEGQINITPGKLQLRVERGNIRTAERILRMLGREWTTRGKKQAD